MKYIQLLIVISFLTISCNFDKDNKSEKTVVIPVENDIQTLDPASLSDPYTSRIVWQVYEGLISLDDKGLPLPQIAKSWHSDSNNSVWTFNIRKGVYFHKSGIFNTRDSTRMVNASDVSLSYTHFANGFGSFVFSGLVSGFESYLKKSAQEVSGFKILNDTTFQIILLRSDPSFIYRLTSPYLCIMPSEILTNANENKTGQAVIGTGPFTFISRTQTEVVLLRNQKYWKKTYGNVNKITFRVEKNQQLRVDQFKNGQYSLIQVPFQLTSDFFTNGSRLKESYEKNFSVYTKTTFNVHYLGINCLSVKDIHLRRAVNFSIDKSRIVHQLLHNQAIEAISPVPPGMQDYYSPLTISYNSDSARKELALSRYDGKTLNILVSDASNSEQIGQVIQSDLQKVGIKTVIEKVDFNTLITRVFGANRPDMFVIFSEWIFSAPELITDAYNSKKIPNPNIFGYKNKNVDAMLSVIPSLNSRALINEQCNKIENVALREVPAVWLFHQDNVYLVPKSLSGFSVNAHNYWNLADIISK